VKQVAIVLAFLLIVASSSPDWKCLTVDFKGWCLLFSRHENAIAHIGKVRKLLHMSRETAGSENVCRILNLYLSLIINTTYNTNN
jgi:hypothetical protein